MSGPPPIVQAGFAAECKEVADMVDKNYEKLVQTLVSSALTSAGIEPRIRVTTLMKMCQSFVIPQVQKFEGGWGDHPNDFQGNYNRLFIEIPKKAGLNAIAVKAEALAKKYPNVRDGDRRGEHVKGALYTFNTSHKVASLFIWNGLSKAETGYPIAVMAEDAWLGYIQFEMCWGGGAGSVFGTGKASYDGVAKKKYGRVAMGAKGWVKWISQTLGPSKTPAFAVDCFASQVDFYDRISRPGSKNNTFRKGWFNRLINWPTSDLKMCIILNEVFNKNVKGMFEFNEKETEFLTQKAKIYESMTINYPTGG